MWLIRHGIPLDLAFQLDDVTRAAWCIIVSEQGGAQFDVNTMSFKDAEQ